MCFLFVGEIGFTSGGGRMTNFYHFVWKKLQNVTFCVRGIIVGRYGNGAGSKYIVSYE